MVTAEIKAYGYIAEVPVQYLIEQGMCEFRTSVQIYGIGVENNTYHLIEEWRNKNVKSSNTDSSS